MFLMIDISNENDNAENESQLSRIIILMNYNDNTLPDEIYPSLLPMSVFRK